MATTAGFYRESRAEEPMTNAKKTDKNNKTTKNPVLKEILVELEKERKDRVAFPYWGNWSNWRNWGNWYNGY
jgi:hypothetical protein